MPAVAATFENSMEGGGWDCARLVLISKAGTVHIRNDSSNLNDFRFGNEPFDLRTRLEEEATATDSRAMCGVDQGLWAILLRPPAGR